MHGRNREDQQAEAAAQAMFSIIIVLFVGLFKGIGSLCSELGRRLPTGVTVGFLVGSFGIRRSVGIPGHKRFEHAAIIGATGSGKTTVLKHIITADVKAQNENGSYTYGMVIIDAKGDALDEILPLVPADRTGDVIIVNPTDHEHAVGIAMLERPTNPDDIPHVVSELVGVFKKTLGTTWGHRMEHTLRNCLYALIAAGGKTLMDVRPFLTDEVYRDACLTACGNPAVVGFWQDEFNTYGKSQQNNTIAPILNRVGYFTTYPTVRNMLCQQEHTLSFAEIMQEGKILIVNLPATIGEDVASFLGALIVSKIQIATMQRAAIPPHRRKPFLIYIDEAQNFVSTNSFERILTEARAMKVGFLLATQFLERLPGDLRQTITKNVATLLFCYRDQGYYQVLYRQPQDFGAEDLTLNAYPPLTFKPEAAARVAQKVRLLKEQSRRTYARPRKEVEREILGNHQEQPPRADTHAARRPVRILPPPTNGGVNGVVQNSVNGTADGAGNGMAHRTSHTTRKKGFVLDPFWGEEPTSHE